VLLNAAGETIDRWIGYTKDGFIETSQLALADLSTIEQKVARFHQQPTAALAATLARYHGTLREYQESVAMYERAQELDPGADYSLEIFDAIFYGARRDQGFTFEDTRAAADRVVASTTSAPADVLDMAYMMSYAASNAGEPAAVVPYLKAAFERSEGVDDERVVSRREGLAPLHALYIEKDEAKAVELKKAAMDEGWMDDAGALNSFAWWCFEHRVNLPEALELADRGIELAEPGRQKAMILDTAAEICNQLDDCQRAVELTQRAINEDPDNDFYKQQLERFEERLAQKG
jgi:tetratricopeptide (TPR) repeat protein